MKEAVENVNDQHTTLKNPVGKVRSTNNRHVAIWYQQLKREEFQNIKWQEFKVLSR